MSRSFDRRALVAIGATVSGLALPLTGPTDHVLHGPPPSPGLHAWGSAHLACGVLFTGFVAGHVVRNRRGFCRYCTKLAAHLPFLTKEGLAAVAIILLVVAAAVGPTLIAR